jgi:putative transposase
MGIMGGFAVVRGDTSGGGLLREAPEVKFAFIDAEKAFHRITKLCWLLKVSRAGFYAWCGRPPSGHAIEDARLTILVREAHERSRRSYGSPRVHVELAETHQVFVSRKRVIRIMQQEGLKARVRKRFKCTTNSDHDQPVAANLLDRNFEADRPNQKWVGDTTELVTSNGKLFLAVILDLFSKFVVGWSLSPVNDRHLTIAALKRAVLQRCPGADLLHHSDQGSTYASEDYQKTAGSSAA